MQYIDAFTHFFPPALWKRMIEAKGSARNIGARMQGIPAIYDLDRRFEVMDEFDDYRQVISLGMPPLETLGAPEETVDYARIGNDGLAELVAVHPDRFVGFAASLSLNDPDAAVKEAERALTELGASGIQIHTNVNGAPLDEPRFRPVFEEIARHGRPVFLHPARTSAMPDYATEDRSRYEIWWTFGWPYETSAAMARMVFSGMLDELPDLKVMAHHLGAMIPYFEGRVGPGWDQLGSRTTDEDLGAVLSGLKRRPFDYFKDFYVDSATFGSRSAMVCGLDFYGADKVLFASDCPFDPEKGPGYIRSTIAVLNSMDLDQETREKICFRNAVELFDLKI